MELDVAPPPGWDESQFNALYYLQPPYSPQPVVPIPQPPATTFNVDSPPAPTPSRPPVGFAPGDMPPSSGPVTVSYTLWVEFPEVNWPTLQAVYLQYVQAYTQTGDGWSSIAGAPAAVGYATSMLEWYTVAGQIMGGDFYFNVESNGVTARGRLPVQVFVTYTPTV